MRARVARAFHREGPLRAGPLVRIDGAHDQPMLERALVHWLTGGRGDGVPASVRVAERGTLFIDALHALGDTSQRMLLAFVQRCGGSTSVRGDEDWGGRLIVGAPAGLIDAVEAGRFSARLFDTLDRLRVDLRPSAARGAA
jgi:DNA-binding NtrC family response regulator